MKVYFFPGLGADASLAPFHPLPGFDVEWVKWPSKIQNQWHLFEDDVFMQNPIESGSVFVGISFGGMVAQRISLRQKPKCIILISSLTQSKSISWKFRILKPFLKYIPAYVFKMNFIPVKFAGWFFGIHKQAHLRLLFEMGKKLKPADFKALNQLALNFESVSHDDIPIFRIHGQRDKIILADSENREKIIPEGGHLISMTHSKEVNASILKWIEQSISES
jgi:pimeloyl-ACP methyl ester carboxylesterase